MLPTRFGPNRLDRKSIWPEPRKQTKPPRHDEAAFYWEWGLGVTICIAVASVSGVIVTVSDRRITWDSFGTASEDNAVLKTALIAKRWGVMFSGPDIRPFGALLAGISGRLSVQPNFHELNAAQVREATQAAYRQAFEDQFVAERLSRYGFSSMAQFREDGLRVFGDDLMAKFCKEIDEYDFGVDLICYGFDREFSDMHIFTVQNPGMLRDCNAMGYGIIGSGHDAALASLVRKPFKRPVLSDAIWRLCEAKFAAESSFAVGKNTSVILLRQDGRPHQLSQGTIDAIRQAWEADRKISTPAEANKIIREHLKAVFPKKPNDET